jgi:anaerobic selenocysteine-containing dehydrogenase
VGSALLITFSGRSYKTQISWGKQLEITNADGDMTVWFLDSLDKAEYLILVDPRATRLASRADLWLRVRPGTDAALALGILNVIVNEGLYDKEFVENWTYGFEKLTDRVQECPPQWAAETTWVPEDKIVDAARILATEGPACLQIGQSVETGNNSIQTLRAIVSLMAVTGNIERPGGMVNWVPPETGALEAFARKSLLPRGLPWALISFDSSVCHPFLSVTCIRSSSSSKRATHQLG